MAAQYILNNPLKRNKALDILKEVDYLTNRIYDFNYNESNDQDQEMIKNVALHFLKNNISIYSIPEYYYSSTSK